MLPSDLIKLKRIGKFSDKFVDDIMINEQNVKILKKKKNSSDCIFWDRKKGCTIYHDRPFDCRMFPFDIRRINYEYYWIIFSCNPNADWQWTEEHLQKLENDPQFADIMKNIESYSSVIVSKFSKVGPLNFTILRRVRSASIVLSNIR